LALRYSFCLRRKTFSGKALPLTAKASGRSVGCPVVSGFPCKRCSLPLTKRDTVRVPWLDGRYSASSLLWTHPTPRRPGPVVMSFHPTSIGRRGLSVPDFVFRHAPSPLTPESPAAARTRCLAADAGLVLSDGLATLAWCNEAELGSLSATARAFALCGASCRESLPEHARRATWLTGHSMVNSFQFTRQKRFH